MREIAIVGAGIVGASLALDLARRSRLRITVVDRGGAAPLGSTIFAPGFVGHYNDAAVLVRLARASVAVYRNADRGFAQAGGLELATTEAGAAEIERRSRAARAAGLASEMVDPARAIETVPFVDGSAVVAAARCSDDAVVDPPVLRAALQAQAERHGARFVEGNVVAIDAGDRVRAVMTAEGQRFAADDVVLAGGVWGPWLAKMVGLTLPLFPVAHPYVYSAAHARHSGGPFVRWPEHHVYARMHGDRLGIGSYDHAPVLVGQDELQQGANLVWAHAFDRVILDAQRLLAADARFAADRRVNGVFAMTPDNLPFLGPHPGIAGLWIAQAIWITHAAGAAGSLAAAMLDRGDLAPELAVDRFEGRDEDELERAALRLYRDIYANDSVAA